MTEITWGESEWADDGFTAELAGYTADVYPNPLDEGRGWSWRVDATADVSEWPELQDCGHDLPDAAAAKAAAEHALRKVADRRLDRLAVRAARGL